MIVKTEIITQTHKASNAYWCIQKGNVTFSMMEYSIPNPQQRLQAHRALGIVPA